MLTFKDFVVAPVEGVDEYIQYRNQKRRRGVIGESSEEAQIEEELNLQQRMKKKAQMKRLKARIQLGRKRAMKKRANPEKIKARAEKRARMAMFKKLAGGKSKDEMSYSMRATVEKRVSKKMAAVRRMAKKMLPTVRKDDMNKMVHKGK